MDGYPAGSIRRNKNAGKNENDDVLDVGMVRSYHYGFVLSEFLFVTENMEIEMVNLFYETWIFLLVEWKH